MADCGLCLTCFFESYQARLLRLMCGQTCGYLDGRAVTVRPSEATCFVFSIISSESCIGFSACWSYKTGERVRKTVVFIVLYFCCFFVIFPNLWRETPINSLARPFSKMETDTICWSYFLLLLSNRVGL